MGRAGRAELQTFAVDVTTRRVTIRIIRATQEPERDFTAISELAFGVIRPDCP